MDNILILDREETLRTILSKDTTDETRVPLLSATAHSQLSSYDVIDLEVLASHPDAALIPDDGSMLLMDDQLGWREYHISSVLDIDSTVITKQVKGELSSVELEDAKLEEFGLPDTGLAAQAEVLLKGTRFQVGTVDQSIKKRKFATDELHHKSALENIYFLAKQYECDAYFSYSVEKNKITGRYVNFISQLGSDSGKRFEVGKDVTTVQREIDYTGIKTAIIPTGDIEQENNPEASVFKEELTIEDVEWHQPKNPTFKPKGQKWLGDPKALERWGRVGSDGQKVHRFIHTHFSIKDPDELARMAWVELGKYKNPKITYTLNVVDLYRLTGEDDLKHEAVVLGDTVAVIDAYFPKKMLVRARVTKIDKDILDPTRTKITLGDIQQTYTSQSVSREDKLNGLISKVINQNDEFVNALGNTSQGFYGSAVPVNPKKGAYWVRPHPQKPDETQFLVWDGTQWVVEMDTSVATEAMEKTKDIEKDLAQSKEEIKETQKIADEGIKKAEAAEKAAHDAIEKAQEFDDIVIKVDDIGELSNSAKELADQAKKDAATAQKELGTVKEQAAKAALDAAQAVVKGNLAGEKADKAALEITKTNDLVKAKADKTVVDSINRTVVSHSNLIQLNSDSLKAKADKTVVDAMAKKITLQGTELSQNSEAIKAKADKSVVDLMGKEVSKATADVKLAADKVEIVVKDVNKQGAQISNIEQTAGKLQSNISKVESDFKNLSVGGRNLLSTSGWTKGYYGSKGGMLVELTSQDFAYIPEIKAESLSYVIQTWADQKYITTGLVGIVCFDSENKFIDRKTLGQLSAGHTAFNIELTKETSYFKISLPFTPAGLRESKYKLEKGTVATDWQPAPEDLATLTEMSDVKQTVDKLQTTVKGKADMSQVTQLSGEVKSTVQQVNNLYEPKANMIKDSMNIMLNKSDSGISGNHAFSEGYFSFRTGNVVADVFNDTDIFTTEPRAKSEKFTLSMDVNSFGAPFSIYIKSSDTWEGPFNVKGASGRRRVYIEYTQQDRTANSALPLGIKISNIKTFSRFEYGKFKLIKGHTQDLYDVAFDDVVQKTEITQLSDKIQAVVIGKADKSQITQLSGEISSAVQKAGEAQSQVNQVAGQISSLVKKTDGTQSKVDQMSSQITSAVTKADNAESKVNQQAGQISSVVKKVDGQETRITQLSSQVTSVVADTNGMKSTVLQMKNQISSIVEDEAGANEVTDPDGDFGLRYWTATPTLLSDRWSVDRSAEATIGRSASFVCYSSEVLPKIMALRSEVIPVNVGEPCSAAVKVKILSGTPDREVKFQLEYHDDEGLVSEDQREVLVDNYARGWQHLKIEDFVVPAGIKYARLVFYVQKSAHVAFCQPQFLSNSRYIPEYTYAKKGLKSQVTQLAGQMQSTVQKGEIISTINQSPEKIILDARLVHITGRTVIDDAAIKSAAIQSISADKISAGTLNARQINVINLDAGSISTGTLRAITLQGNNLTINLSSGDVLFKKGFIRNSDDGFIIDIARGTISSTTKSLSHVSGFTIQKGEIAFNRTFGTDPTQIFSSLGFMYSDYAGLGSGTGAVLKSHVTKVNGDYGTNGVGLATANARGNAVLSFDGAGVVVTETSNQKGQSRFSNYDTFAKIFSRDYIYVTAYNRGAGAKKAELFLSSKVGSKSSASLYGEVVTIGTPLGGSAGTITLGDSTTVNKDFRVVGKKNAIHITRDGMRETPAYETAESYLGDLGKSVTSEDCSVVIPVDELFSDTVNMGIEYHVFISSYSDDVLWVSEMTETHFVVRSRKPLAEFSWELKAKRRGYESDRLVLCDDIDNKQIEDIFREAA